MCQAYAFSHLLNSYNKNKLSNLPEFTYKLTYKLSNLPEFTQQVGNKDRIIDKVQLVMFFPPSHATSQ